MNPNSLEQIGKYAGVIGIVVFIVYLLFRRPIGAIKPSPKISKLLIICICFLFLSAIAAWGFVRYWETKASAPDGKQVADNPIDSIKKGNRLPARADTPSSPIVTEVISENNVGSKQSVQTEHISKVVSKGNKNSTQSAIDAKSLRLNDSLKRLSERKRQN